MNTPQFSEAEVSRIPATDWPHSVTEEWCRMHRLIDELSAVQRRLGTPFEEPEDFLKVRGLGSDIREMLDHLSPWLPCVADVQD